RTGLGKCDRPSGNRRRGELPLWGRSSAKHRLWAAQFADHKIAIPRDITHVMIALIFDLGVGLATFAALAAAFFRKPGAALRARNRAWGSVVAIPCCFPAGPRGRDIFFPAGRARDLTPAIYHPPSYA